MTSKISMISTTTMCSEWRAEVCAGPSDAPPIHRRKGILMNHCVRTLAAAAAGLVVCVSGAAAQRVPRALAGLDTTARVRFLAPTVVSTREPLTGNVLSVNDTAMVVRWDLARQDEPLTVPYSALTSLEVSRGFVSAAAGRRRGARTGVLVGGFLGVVGGYAIAAHKHFDDGLTPRGPALREWGIGIAAASVAGGAIGALVGTHGYERWKRVSRPRVGPSARRGAE